MLLRYFLILLPLLSTSCGYRKWWGPSETQRKLASAGLQQMLREDELTFEQHLTDRLTSIHYYTMIGHKNLQDFDESLEYDSIPYQNLIALRTQIDELEREVKEEYQILAKARDQKKILLLKSLLTKFAGHSKFHALSLENLLEALSFGDLLPLKATDIHFKEIDEHYKTLQTITEFQIQEKNIDHLSHMIDLKFDSSEKRFAPSSAKMGNLSGSEFPQKIWALTFEDGPSSTSLSIIKELQKHNFKATFFQVNEAVRNYPDVLKKLKEAQMEVGAHSWSHLDLTKVGNLTLDKEITESIQKLNTKLYRLPYGAGLNTAHIRERMAQNDVYHVFWSVDALDWMPQSPQRISNRTIKLMKKSLKDSGIILFHENHTRTLLSLPEVLDYLKKDGRKVCPVGQIIQEMNQGATIVCR
jgi:peptidoglycan/xylan/chitin deacetylase (PgdA/CDA1 family)